MASVEKNIERIQKRLFSDDIDGAKVLKYIKYLEQMEVTVEVLKRTGIGKTINALKKMEGPIGEAALNLIKKWKDLVTGPVPETYKDAEPSPAKLNKSLLLSSHSMPSLNNLNGDDEEDDTRTEQHSSHKHSKHKKEKHHKHREKEKKDKQHCTESKPKAPSLQLCDVSFGCEIQPEAVKPKRKETQPSTRKDKQPRYDDNSSNSPFLPPLPSSYSVNESLLPEIQPSYRPSRSLDLDGSPSKKNKGTISGTVLRENLTSKKSRTQVFSGRRNAAACGIVTSLFDTCLKVLIDNVEALHDTGGVPYDILAPVLQKCTPQQLMHLEECNPYFIEDTNELWKMHCKREFKCEKPERKMTWRETYMIKLEEREERLEKINAKISAAQAAKKPERQVKLAYVMTEAKPPPQIRRKQAKFGTGGKVDIPLISPCSSSSSRPKQAPRQHSADQSTSYAHEQREAKKKPGVAPMMKKTMKLLKIQRNCAGSQIKRR